MILPPPLTLTFPPTRVHISRRASAASSLLFSSLHLHLLSLFSSSSLSLSHLVFSLFQKKSFSLFKTPRLSIHFMTFTEPDFFFFFDFQKKEERKQKKKLSSRAACGRVKEISVIDSLSRRAREKRERKLSPPFPLFDKQKHFTFSSSSLSLVSLFLSSTREGRKNLNPKNGHQPS